MPTEFTDFDSGDIIEASHVKQTFEPIKNLEKGATWYREAEFSSLTNTYKVSFASGNLVDAYTRGLLVNFKAKASNTGPSFLIITGPSGDLASMELTKRGGQALEEGDILENQVVSVVFTEDLDSNDSVIAQRFEIVGGIGLDAGPLSNAAWAIFEVLNADLTQSDLSDLDLPLGLRREGEQLQANANHRVSLSAGLYSISFAVSCEITSGDAVEVGVYDYSSGGGPVRLLGSSLAVIGDQEAHDAPVGHAVLSVAQGQTKEIGLRTGSRSADGTIYAGKGFFKVLKVSGGVASSEGVSNLDGLADVSIDPSPSDGEILQFDSATGKFRNAPFSGGAVDSVFGRTGAVGAASGDYAASQVSDDSGVTSPATNVANALSQLEAGVSTNASNIAGKENVSNKNQSGGYAGLNGNGRVPLNRGGTGADLSVTGGTGQVLKQSTLGGNITVSPLSAGDMPSGIDAVKIAGGAVSNAEFAHLDGVTSSIQDQLDNLAQNLVPVGALIPFAGLQAPPGWLLCYGQSVDKASYPLLWDAVKQDMGGGVFVGAYDNGGGTSTTFKLPDLRGRVTAGRDNMGGASANRITSGLGGPNMDGTVLGNSGGSDRHQLTTAQMPAHNHGVSDPGHRHQDFWDQSVLNYNPGNPTRPYSDARGGISNYRFNYTSYSTTGISINSAGSGQSHNNLQPTLIINYLIFAGF